MMSYSEEVTRVYLIKLAYILENEFLIVEQQAKSDHMFIIKLQAL